MKNKTFKIITFGCKTNIQESDYLSQELKKNEMLEVGKKDFAAYTIINSCSVTSNTDNEVLYVLRKQKQLYPDTKIILTGCMAQADSENLSKNKDIYMLLGNSEKLNIVEFIKSDKSVHEVQNLLTKSDFDEFDLHASKRTRATLKIQDGCNNFCSYCIIPFTRGKSRSRKLYNIIDNVNEYISNGHKEIVLSAIHLGLWGQDFEPRLKFVDLLKELEKIDAPIRYRIGSLDPKELDEELMEFLVSSKKVCNHLHVSLQTMNDKILNFMNRHYTVQETFEKLNYLNANIKNLNIGADIIVGFPGETDADFFETYDNLEKLPLGYMHIFPYSVRKFTKAASMPNHLSEACKKERANNLKKLAVKKQNDFLLSMLDFSHQVLIENNKTPNGVYKGVSSNYLKFLVESSENISNTVVELVGLKIENNKILAKINK